MDDYFDYYPELETRLNQAGKEKELAEVRRAADLANIFYVRQKETKGLGHAISRARRFVGDEPFAVLLGDDIMRARKPVMKQLIEAAEKYSASCVGVQKVSTEAISKYSSVKISPLEDRIFSVSDMNEKPAPTEMFSNYAILGRYVLTPDIFDILEHQAPGYGGEIQLTDGLRTLCRQNQMIAVDFEGRRYDTGNLKGFWRLPSTSRLNTLRPAHGSRALSRRRRSCSEFLTDKTPSLPQKRQGRCFVLCRGFISRGPLPSPG